MWHRNLQITKFLKLYSLMNGYQNRKAKGGLLCKCEKCGIVDGDGISTKNIKRKSKYKIPPCDRDSQTSQYFTPVSMQERPKTSKSHRKNRNKIEVHIGRRKKRLEDMPPIQMSSNCYDPDENLDDQLVIELTDSASSDYFKAQRASRKYNPQRATSDSSDGRKCTNLPQRVKDDKKEICSNEVPNTSIRSQTRNVQCSHQKVYKPKKTKSNSEQTERLHFSHKECQVSTKVKITTIDTALQTEIKSTMEKECQFEKRSSDEEKRIILAEKCLQTEQDECCKYEDRHERRVQDHPFPFVGESPSGNLKVPKNMIAYENQRMGIIIADPNLTRLQHQEWDEDNEIEPQICGLLLQHTSTHVPKHQNSCRRNHGLIYSSRGEKHKTSCKASKEKKICLGSSRNEPTKQINDVGFPLTMVNNQGCENNEEDYENDEFAQTQSNNMEPIPQVCLDVNITHSDTKTWGSSVKRNEPINNHSHFHGGLFNTTAQEYDTEEKMFHHKVPEDKIPQHHIKSWTHSAPPLPHNIYEHDSIKSTSNETMSKSLPPKVPSFPSADLAVHEEVNAYNSEQRNVDTTDIESLDSYAHNVRRGSKKNFDFMENLHYRIKRAIHPDTKVIIGNHEFPIHALALQIHSKYFDTLRRPPEAVQMVELPESVVTSEDFRNIMDWILTEESDRKMILHRDNVVGLYSAAQYLGMAELKSQCLEYVKDKVESDDPKLIKLWEDAQNKPKTRELVAAISQKLVILFPKLYKSRQFLKLDVNDLVLLLDSDDVVIESEMDIFDAAVRWLLYDWQKRKRHTAKVMSSVRFGLLTPLQLTQIPNLSNNKEAPDFKKIFALDCVKRMLQDGLTYAIFKQSYGKRSVAELTKWVQSSGVTPPRTRNHLDPELEDQHQRSPGTLHSLEEFVDGIIDEGANFVDDKTTNEQNASHVMGLEETNPTDTTPLTLDQEFQPAIESEMSLDEIPYSMDPSKSTFPSQKDLDSGEYILAEQNENEIQAAITIQRYIRGYLTRKHSLKMNHAAKVIQNAVRGYWAKKRNDYRPIKEHAETKPLRDSYSTSLTEPVVPYLQANLRVPSEGLLVFGGTDPTHVISSIQSSNTGAEILMYGVKSLTWTNVGSLPEPRTHFGITRVGYDVYIIGGTDPRYKTSNERNIAVKSVWKVNLRTSEWYYDSNHPSDLDSPRSHFGCATKDGSIYVFGGNDAEARGLSTCRKYDTTFNAWTQISSMDGPRISMGVAVYENHIWVAGGISKNPAKPVLKSVLCYDTITNSWTASRSLPLPRAYFTLVVAHGKLFIVGGAGPRNKTSKTQVSLPDVMVLDKTSSQWREVGVLEVPRHGHAAVAIDHQIVVLGGVSSDRMGSINSVELFDLSTSHSEKGRSLHQKLSGMGAVSIQ